MFWDFMAGLSETEQPGVLELQMDDMGEFGQCVPHLPRTCLRTCRALKNLQSETICPQTLTGGKAKRKQEARANRRENNPNWWKAEQTEESKGKARYRKMKPSKKAGQSKPEQMEANQGNPRLQTTTIRFKPWKTKASQ